jgi:hypothetical protein
MDYDKIINDIENFHFLVCNDEKCKIISSAESKKEAKEKMIEILEPKWEKLIGTTIFLVILEKSKKNWDKKKDILVPGPIMMGISDYKIEKNNKIKMFSSGINSNVYFSEKYFEKNKKIKKKDIREMVLKYQKRELKKGLMAKNVL